MTPKTLSKERREKFEKLIADWLANSPAILDVTDDEKLLQTEIMKFAFDLSKAAESRSEVRGIEAAIFGGRPVTEEDLEEKVIRAACNEFESALGFGSLPWDSTANWAELRKFIVKLYQSDPQEFRKFEAWRMDAGKYQGCTNKSIRENPVIFKDTHYPTYKAHSTMRKTDESRPEYQPYKPEEKNYVPRPANIKPVIRKPVE